MPARKSKNRLPGIILAIVSILGIDLTLFQHWLKHRRLGMCSAYAYELRFLFINNFRQSELFSIDEKKRFTPIIKARFSEFTRPHAVLHLIFHILGLVKLILLLIFFFRFPSIYQDITNTSIAEHGATDNQFYFYTILLLVLSAPTLLMRMNLVFMIARKRFKMPRFKLLVKFIVETGKLVNKIYYVVFFLLTTWHIFFNESVTLNSSIKVLLAILWCISSLRIIGWIFLFIRVTIESRYNQLRRKTHTESNITIYFLFLLSYVGGIGEMLDLPQRRKIVNMLIDNLATLIETELHQTFSGSHLPSEQASKTKLARIAAAFRKRKIDVSFYGKDIFRTVGHDIGRNFISFMSYHWNDFAESEVFAIAPSTKLGSVKRILVTLLTAILPLAGVLLANEWIAGFTKEKFEYGLSISILWCAFTIINIFDPRISNNLSSMKDIKDIASGAI